jgi:HK97 family phage prohead protease
MPPFDAPRDNLFRGLPQAPELRAEGDTEDTKAADSPSLMFGHFAVFDTWTEVDSWYEGQFLERLAAGCFKKTMVEQRNVLRVQFDHGYDLHVNDAPLGPIDELKEDDEGAYYEVPLLDTDYNRNRIQPLLEGRLMNGESRGSQLGASFQFRVVADEWNNEPEASDYNPKGLPERTIREVRLYEFGPVVFPQYPEASSGVRSLTDHFIARRLARQGVAERAANHIASSTAGMPTADSRTPKAGTATSGSSRSQRQRALDLLKLTGATS